MLTLGQGGINGVGPVGAIHDKPLLVTSRPGSAAVAKSAQPTPDSALLKSAVHPQPNALGYASKEEADVELGVKAAPAPERVPLAARPQAETADEIVRMWFQEVRSMAPPPTQRSFAEIVDESLDELIRRLEERK